VHAVGRRAGDEIHVRLRPLEHSQRHIERQRVAGTAAVAIRRHDCDLRQGGEGLPQGVDALGTKPVVVADQNLQESRCQAGAFGGRVTILQLQKAPARFGLAHWGPRAKDVVFARLE
jgi:hypothetical protein